MAIIIPIVSAWNPAGLNKAIRDIKAAQGAIATLQVSTAALGAAATLQGTKLTRNFTVPLAAIGGVAIKQAMDFETSFAKIEGLVGVAKADLKELQNAAKTLGPAYGQSATEAAEALFFITSAGFRGADAIDVLDKSLKASMVGLGDAKTIADLTTSAINAYGASELDAARATDILTAAIRLGKLEPEALAGVISNVLPLAASLGVEFDEVSAALAAMSKSGTDATVGATQLRGIFSSLQSVTPKAERQLNEFGLSGEGLRKELKDKGLLSVLQTLTDTFGDNDVAISNVFGNVRALTGVLSLMGPQAEVTEEIFAGVADSLDILDEAAAIAAETTGQQLKVAMADLKTTFLELGEVLIPIFVNTIIPAVKDLAGKITDLIEKFKNLSPETQDLVIKFIGLVAIAGPVLFIFGKIFSAVGPLISIIVLLGKALLFLTLNPIGAVILGIAALIALIVLLVKNWDNIKEAASNAWTKIKEIVGVAKDFIVEKFKELGQYIIENHPLLKLFRAVKEFAPTVLEWFRDLGVKIFDGLRDGVNSSVAGFVTSIRNGVAAGVDAVKRLLKMSSPSRVFADIGKNTIAGYVNGVKSMSNVLDTTMSGVAMNSTVAFSGGVSPAQRGAAAGGAVINVTVNAGMGANGTQIGREIVDAIKRFEKTSGPVFASA